MNTLESLETIMMSSTDKVFSKEDLDCLIYESNGCDWEYDICSAILNYVPDTNVYLKSPSWGKVNTASGFYGTTVASLYNFEFREFDGNRVTLRVSNDSMANELVDVRIDDQNYERMSNWLEIQKQARSYAKPDTSDYDIGDNESIDISRG